jgi:GntR family transcriptional regulator/MocR family aminotransferase
MPLEWSSSGVDVHLEIDRQHVGRSLEAALRRAVRSGALVPGTVLPSSRALAADLGIARNTVVGVYDQLIAEGWLSARPGSRTRVAERDLSRPHSPAAPAGVTLRPASVPFDLRPGSPDITVFPRREWLAAGRRALRSAPDAVFGYGDPRGLPQLREELAAYLARVRGVVTSPEHIVVCLGTMHALTLLTQVLVQRGAAVWAVERYGLPIAADIARTAGLTLQHLEVDHDGADVAALTTADAAYLSPAHQFPLGTTLSAARRNQVVAWAQTHDRLVIEDDYDGEYRYDRQPIGALQSLDPDRVVYLGTISKSLAPSLRIGWLVAPPDLLPDLMTARTIGFGYCSSLDQLTLAELLRSGTYDRLLRSSRIRYRRRRNQLIKALQPHGLQVSGAAAGLHALVRLPPGADEADVIGRAQQRGLAVEGLGAYTVDGSADSGPALVVGYGAAAEDSYQQCLTLLVEALTPQVGRGRGAGTLPDPRRGER